MLIVTFPTAAFIISMTRAVEMSTGVENIFPSMRTYVST